MEYNEIIDASLSALEVRMASLESFRLSRAVKGIYIRAPLLFYV